MSRLIPTYIEQALRIEVLERAVIASEGDVERLKRELAEAKEQLRLCNVDQFTTAAELAEATVKESLIAQRPWVGLTAEDMADAHNSTSGDVMMRLAGFARAIEAKLRDKNT